MKTDPIITKTKFRLMIVFFWITAFIYGFFESYNETSLVIEEILHQEPQLWEWVILGSASIVFIIVEIGLLMLKEWARKIYIYGYFPILLIYLLPSFSWSFMQGIGAIFYELGSILATLLWGILVVPSLYQPLFQKSIK